MADQPPVADSADTEIVLHAREGDRGSYRKLIEHDQDVAFRTAYLVTRSAADAEDAAQDAFVKAYALSQ